MEEKILIAYKKKLCEVMKAFIAFCDEHKLNYFVSGGTAIGAVRHQGIIPWDDDIDVYMLRPDYDSFLSLRRELEDTKYEIIDFTDGTYPLQTFAKFSDKTTTVWEYEDSPYITGVWVDIFPLDEASKDFANEKEIALEYKWTIDYYRRSCHKHSLKSLWHNLCYDSVRACVSCLKDIFYYIPYRKKYHKRLLELQGQIKEFRGDYLYCYGIHLALPSKLYPKEWFSFYREMPFEDFTVRVHNGVDNYLRQQFGDYMLFPPEDDRKSLHQHYYINLDRRLSIDELRRLKKNEAK